MAVAVSIALGILGVGAVIAVHGVGGDVVGGAVAIGALVVLTRSVIRRAADAGTGP